jgi:hypothetical protein
MVKKQAKKRAGDGSGEGGKFSAECFRLLNVECFAYISSPGGVLCLWSNWQSVRQGIHNANISILVSLSLAWRPLGCCSPILCNRTVGTGNDEV